MKKVHIIGAGLAGSEAAWQIAQAGIPVILHEMKPLKYSAAHSLPFFAELVCSNSLRSNLLENAVGTLKQELRYQKSLIMQTADLYKVPAGGALAVDRIGFAKYITDTLTAHPLIEIKTEEVQDLAKFDLRKDYVLIASGPLTGDALFQSLQDLLGEDELYFFDAVAPIIEKDSINQDKVFRASRYDKGDGEYINCPFTETEYLQFYQALIQAKTAEVEAFDDLKLFQGCMPVEAIAKRGQNALLFGPMKPVGLIDPKTNQQAYAIVQLRQDNQAGTLYNIVGFQTRLTFPEQKRIFRMIPGLEHAIFERYGVMHRNSFINSPNHLKLGYQYKKNPHLFFAGQITGVEGYVESVGSGLVAAKCLINDYQGKELEPEHYPTYLEPETILGSMAHYVCSADPEHFQPMNANFGLVPEIKKEMRSQLKQRYNITEKGRVGRRLLYSHRALSHYDKAL